MSYAKAGEVREFVPKHRLSYPNLSADGEVVPRLGGAESIGMPRTLIFNPQGQRAARQRDRVLNNVIEDCIARPTLGSAR